MGKHKKLSHNQFIDLLLNNESYQNNEISLLSEFVNDSTKILIRTKYGNCEVLPYILLENKEPCITSAINKTEFFIKKSKEIHGCSKYDYSKSIYLNAHNKVKIICPRHGEFEQKPCSHLNRRGCMRCHIDAPVGWDVKKWEDKANESKHFDSFKVYIIECWNENERFYKIGRTFNTVNHRFMGKGKLPFNFKILRIFTGKVEEIFNLEIQMKIENKDFKYKPSLSFKGKHECYSKILNINI